jgi:Ribbon-helix-helix protein, copG family.
MRIVTFKVDEELLELLDLYCVNNKLHRSEVIRDAIKLYLSNGIENKEGGVYNDT